MKSNYKFLKIFKILFYILGFILSVYGSYQVYHGRFTNVFKEISVIFVSVVKLYTFSPTVGFEAAAPLAYDLAIWMAPVSTVLGFFSIFKRFFQRTKRYFRFLNQPVTIILGNNSYTQAYLKNHSDKRVMVLVKESTELSESQYLEQGVKVELLNKSLILPKKIERILAFDSYFDDYHLFNGANRVFEVYQLIDDIRLKDVLLKKFKQFDNLHINFFSLTELKAISLLDDDQFKFYLTNGLKQSWEHLQFNNLDEIANQIGQVHLVLFGQSDLTFALLRNIANAGCVSLGKKIRVSLVDPQANEIVAQLENSIDEIDQVYKFHAVQVAFDSNSMVDLLAKVHKKNPVTGLVFDMNDSRLQLLSLLRLRAIFGELPIAYHDETGEFTDVLNQEFQQFVGFGNINVLLKDKFIVNPQYLDKAKRFNESYHQTLNKLLNQDYPLVEFNQMNWINQESSQYQAFHQPIKQCLMTKFSEYLNRDLLLDDWQKVLENKTISQQVDCIEADLVMNYMCGLEHQRWCNFYFMRYFTYDKVKNLDLLKHDCLIADWHDFLASDQRDKAIYDFLSVLDLKHNL